jgi:Ca2+-binding RTX toxin-like protein
MKNRKHAQYARAVVGAGAAVASITAGLALASPASASTTAVFVKGLHVLTVNGDQRGSTIIVGRDRYGDITVNGGAVSIRGARATVANVSRIVVLGHGGNDRLAIDEIDGAMPPARLYGGAGDDELFGGSGADHLFGGLGDDVLIGGKGVDQAFGGPGDDQLVWNPGDDSDLNEGGDGTDFVRVNGGAAGEAFNVAADGSRVLFARTNPLPFTLDIGTTERLVLNANAGDDSFTATGDLAPLIALVVDGGQGNDRIVGGNGNDTLLGGDGNDFVNGAQGHDTATLGAGDDTFQWNPGDGSDTIDGQDGHDAMVFNGADTAERFALSADGTAARFTRDIGNIIMDLNGVEQVDTVALGGTDQVTVNDLSGTDVTEADVSLGGAIGGSTGDGSPDLVTVNGTDGADTLKVTGDAPDGVTVSGLQALVRVTDSDGVTDGLAVHTLDGNDHVDTSGLAAGVVGLTVDAGH